MSDEKKQDAVKPVLSLLSRLRKASASDDSKKSPASPLEQKVADVMPKKRGKLGRNLVGVGLTLFVGTLMVMQLIKQGGNLEDQGRVAEASKKKDDETAKNYDARVENPEAVADQNVTEQGAAARAAANLAKPSPQPGGAVPLPKDADILLERDREKLETAWRAIQSGKKASDDKSPGGTSSSSSGTAAAAAADNKSSGADRPEFVGYAETGSSDTKSGLLRAGITTDSQQRNEPPEAAAIRAQAIALRDAQVAQARGSAVGAPAPAITDASTQWLAQQVRPQGQASTLLAKPIVGKHVIYGGTAISAVLEQAMDTSLPGLVRARVTTDIYDSRSGRYLVVPRGSTLLGKYRSNVTDGQARVLMAFDRLITPAGNEVPLGAMSASDALGVGGVPGDLHTHFLKRIGIASLLALEAAVLEKKVGPVGSIAGSSTGGTSGFGQSTSSASGQIVLQTANQELQRQYAVAPNITLPAGALITVVASDNIEIPTR